MVLRNYLKLIQPLWRTVWRFLKKQKIELPYDPATPLLGIYPELSRNPLYFFASQMFAKNLCFHGEHKLNKNIIANYR